MKQIEVSDEVYSALQQLARGFHRTPDAVLANLLNIPGAPDDAADPLAAFLLSPEFRAKFTDADRYLAILAWIAARHPADFAEFIRGLESGRRYFGLTRDEVVATCRHNQARQIEGTPFWAIMNIDSATKRRFLARVLEFTGYHEDGIELACATLGTRRPGAATHWWRR